MSNMANIIGSHFKYPVLSILYMYLILFKNQTYLIDIHCKLFTIPIKETTRVLIAKGGQLTGKMGTMLFIFLVFQAKPA